MDHLPPINWSKFPYYAGLAVFIIALVVLQVWSERREHRRKAAAIRPKLANQRCRRCGGTWADWDEKFLPGDIHFNPGGYVPRVVVRCASCGAEQVFYLLGDYRRGDQGPLVWEYRLFNQDLIYEGTVGDRGESPGGPASGRPPECGPERESQAE